MKRRKFIQSTSLSTISLAGMGFSGLDSDKPRSSQAKYMGGFYDQPKKKP